MILYNVSHLFSCFLVKENEERICHESSSVSYVYEYVLLVLKHFLYLLESLFDLAGVKTFKILLCLFKAFSFEFENFRVELVHDRKDLFNTFGKFYSVVFSHVCEKVIVFFFHKPHIKDEISVDRNKLQRESFGVTVGTSYVEDPDIVHNHLSFQCLRIRNSEKAEVVGVDPSWIESEQSIQKFIGPVECSFMIFYDF